MRRRAGSGFPRSPQLSPEQAANRVVVSRVSTDSGERTPIARDFNSRASPRPSRTRVASDANAGSKRRATANRVRHQAFAFSMLPTRWQLPNLSALADGGVVTAFPGLGYIRFPHELQSWPYEF